jgi:hypothetical protein
MPNKPVKYGVKYFGICDVSTAYLLDTISYTGKSVQNLAVFRERVLELNLFMF